MALRTTTKWLAVSLHYGEPWEELLIKAVKPYIDVVLQTGVADSFYYLRSWEKGPNIRLYFKGNPFILAKMLRPNLDEHFQQYFESRPSFIKYPVYPDRYPDEFKWHPNNTIQYAHADPATDCFGGLKELDLMEKQYELSSKLILNTMKEKASRWTYNEMISTAIKTHLGFAYALGMDLEEAANFFRFLLDNWFDGYYKKQSEDRDKTNQSFAKIYALQRKDVIPYQSALWEMIKNYEQMEDKTFVEWINVNANASLELNFVLDSKKLRPIKVPFNVAYKFPPAWYYYESLVKLTNNRLGIFNKNEGFLLYTMAESLKIVTSSDSVSYMKVHV